MSTENQNTPGTGEVVNDANNDDANSGSATGQNRNTENRRNDNKKKGYRNISDMNEQKGWEGEEPKMGSVLGLRGEWLEKKVSFEVFLEKTTDYILRELTNPRDIVGAIRDLKDPNTDFRKNNLPKDLTTKQKGSDVEVAIQAQRIKMYAIREADMNNNMDKVYGLVKGQCSTSLRTVIKQDPDFVDKDEQHDILWLLKKLKEVTSGLDTKSNKRSNLHEAILVFFTMKQGENESDSNYMKRFETNLETLITAGGKHIMCSPDLMDKDGDEGTEEEIEIEENKFKAICYIKRGDPNRYTSLLNDLKHAAYVGRDEYPDTPAGAFDLMVRRSGAFTTHLGGGGGGRFGGGRGRGFFGGRGSGGRGFNFAQNGGRGSDQNQPPAGTVLVPGKDGKSIRMQCWGCSKWGHASPNCPERSDGRQGSQYMQIGYGFGQNDGCIPASWVLLDTCSTASVFCNHNLVGDLVVCSEDEELMIRTNGGSKCFDLKSKMKLFPIEVHFNSESMANILSLKDVAEMKGARVTMDTLKGREIVVHFNEQAYHFAEHAEGLYYLDMEKIKSNVSVSPYCFLESVTDNKLYFSDNEIKGADKARQLQQ